MKFKKFLPLVLVAPLLASCGGDLKVSEPSFSSYSNKVEYTNFVASMAVAAASNKLYSQDHLASFESSRTESKATTIKYESEKGLEYETKNKGETTFKYDSTNSLLQTDMKIESSLKIKDPYADGSSKQTSESSTFEQSENSNYLVFDLKAKTYANYGNKSDDFIESAARIYATYSVEYSIEYTLDDEEKSKYSYYVDGNVYTFVFSETNGAQIKDSEDKVIGKVSTTTVKKTQVEITTSLVKVAQSEVEETSYEYTVSSLVSVELSTQNTRSVKVNAGDKASKKTEEYAEAKLEFKDVSLTKQNTADFINAGEDD